MARVGISPDARTTIAFEGFVGPEQANNNAALRTGAEVMVSRKIGKVTTSVQADVGREQRNSALPDPTRDARWWAASSWFVIDATPTLGVALRADYLNDRNAARTGSAFALVGAPQHRLASATATLNVKSFPNMLLRPEVRYDRSNQRVFGAQPSQVTFGMSAAYLF
jgi:Putative beta-barrel porin-2, OmpL-like. bbp2